LVAERNFRYRILQDDRHEIHKIGGSREFRNRPAQYARATGPREFSFSAYEALTGSQAAGSCGLQMPDSPLIYLVSAPGIEPGTSRQISCSGF
jgi:hypothetical protein